MLVLSVHRELILWAVLVPHVLIVLPVIIVPLAILAPRVLLLEILMEQRVASVLADIGAAELTLMLLVILLLVD
jgi:hypothetical protein